jgi:hypothetical protein
MLKDKIEQVLELLRCNIINVCFDDTIDKAEELRRQREFITEATQAILKAVEEAVGEDRQKCVVSGKYEEAKMYGYNQAKQDLRTKLGLEKGQ